MKNKKRLLSYHTITHRGKQYACLIENKYSDEHICCIDFLSLNVASIGNNEIDYFQVIYKKDKQQIVALLKAKMQESDGRQIHINLKRLKTASVIKSSSHYVFMSRARNNSEEGPYMHHFIMKADATNVDSKKGKTFRKIRQDLKYYSNVNFTSEINFQNHIKKYPPMQYPQ